MIFETLRGDDVPTHIALAYLDHGELFHEDDCNAWPPGPSLHTTVVSNRRGRIVGFHAYWFDGVALQSSLTWVERHYRRRGLMEQMWRISLGETRPAVVTVSIANPRARRVLEAMAPEYPEIEWVFDGTKYAEKEN
jgi:hypothetical protein